ncbi:MAG: hypothetical protein ACRDHX_17765 [Chloroflexota bacterium]
MAKVMVSLPENVLRAVDIESRRRGITRNGLLIQLAEEMLRRGSARRAERMAEISDQRGPAEGDGGKVAEVVKSARTDH